jgi:hypothetical protein
LRGSSARKALKKRVAVRGMAMANSWLSQALQEAGTVVARKSARYQKPTLKQRMAKVT